MNQLALKEKIGVNYMLLELTGTLNSLVRKMNVTGFPNSLLLFQTTRVFLI
mgnify:CR=1 FL=1